MDLKMAYIKKGFQCWKNYWTCPFNRIHTRSWLGLSCAETPPSKFCGNPFSHFCAILLTNQPNNQTELKNRSDICCVHKAFQSIYAVMTKTHKSGTYREARCSQRAAKKKKATAADIHSYVNGRRSTSAEPKLEAAEVKAGTGLRAPDEIRHGSVQPALSAHAAALRGIIITVIN